MNQAHLQLTTKFHARFITITALFISLLWLLSVPAPVLAQTNDGQLVGSGSFGDEPLVGAIVPFTITVTNQPSPPPGTFFEDRLYNVSAEITLPLGLEYDNCSQEPSSTTLFSPSGGILIFDNIQNLEVNQSISITCNVLITADIDLGETFTVDYEWTSNTLPDGSGQTRGTGPLTIDGVPQAFDLEKEVSVTTGQYQVGGAGAWADGNNGIPVDWDYQYTLTLTNNGLNDSKGLQIIDIVPPGVAYLGVDSFICTTLNTPASLEPNSVVLSDGTPVTIDGQSVSTVDGDLILTWDLDTLFGAPVSLAPDEVCTIIYNAGIPYRYRTSADVSQLPPLPADPFATGVGEFTGGILPHPASHENRYNATGVYDPDPLNPADDVDSGDGVVSTPADDSNVVTPSGYHSIAKDVSTRTVLQDEVIEYTVDGWISEYYDFTPSVANPYVITDVLPDGLDFCGVSRPVGSTPPAYGPNGFYGDPTGCPSVINATFNGVTLNPVSVVQDSDFNLVITWHVTDPALVEASDTWTLQYTAAVRDYYEDGIDRSNPDPATQYWTINGGQPVSGLDVRNNAVDACGDWEDLIDTARTGTDACTDSGTSISLEAPDIDKSLYDPDTNTFIQYNGDNRVQLEVGEIYTYRLLLSFPNDLDMRNVVIDDYLPRGHYYVPDTSVFADTDYGGVTVSEDALTTPFSGASQSAAGADYTGNQYVAEEFQDMGTFLINECPPGAARPAGDPADPFFTNVRIIDDLNPASINLQNMVWYLCRVDNSDNPSDSDILWVVVFDVLIVDDPAIVNNPAIIGQGVRVANYGHLSGTSSFGVTYTLRDNLNITYVAPNLVVRKTNSADNPHNAIDPYTYTINVTNTGLGTAYDWIIRDAIPAGVRIPVGAGSACQGFSTTAPGNFTCVVDAGAQAGTGGFVTITPVDGGSAHDPAREIENGDSYNFTFDAESGGLTPGETLTNTASIEYCTQPTATNTFDHDNNGGTAELPARNCIGYLDDGNPTTAPTSSHSDEGTPPNYAAFVSYSDSDDTASNGSESNNTDNSEVTFAEVELDKTHTPPSHTAPQVTTGDFATIGEAYTVTLEVTIPRRTQLFATEDGYVEVLDTIEQEGVVFCDAASGLPGCVDPTLNNTQGLVTPVGATWWTANNTPNPGSTVQFRLNEIINNDLGSNNDDDEIVFNITFTMFVTGLDDGGSPAYFLPQNNDEAVNSFEITYRNDDATPETFTNTSNDDQIDIDQPYIRAEKDAVDATNGFPVQGGDVIDYQLTYTNTGQSTAFEVSIIDQLPLFITYNDDMTCTSSVGVSTVPGDVTVTDPSDGAPTFSVDLEVDAGGAWDIPPGGTITCEYTVTVDLDVPAGTDLDNFTDADWSTLQGNQPNERIFDDSPNDNRPNEADDDEAEETVPVEQPDLQKTRTSPYNGETPAPVRIGDVVTYQITAPLPIGTTRSLIISDFLEPGLIYREGTTPIIVNEDGDPLDFTTTLNGSNDGIDNNVDPFRIDWAISDPACTTFTPCIFNDGTDNTQVVITFQAVVADVPSNVHGLILDNTVQASYIDGIGGNRVVTDESVPLDDEDVRVVEPVMGLTKTVNATSADAGDVFRYTVVLTNTQTPDPIDPTQPTAYDVTWEDVLDIHLLYNVATMSCDVGTPLVTTSTDAQGRQVLAVTGSPDGLLDPNEWDIEPGDSITCQYDVTVQQTVPPGDNLDNFADVDWTSLDGDVPGSPTEPSERIYDGDTNNDGVEDVLGDGDDDSTIVPVPLMVLDKIVGPTSDPNYQTDNQYQPGQLVPYQITVTLPEGTTERLTVRDDYNQAQVIFDSEVSIVSVPPGATATRTVNAGTGVIEWVFDDISHTGTLQTFPTAAGYQITITYYMRVRENATFTPTFDVVNSATALHDIDGDDVVDPSTQLPLETAFIQIERPALLVQKTANDLTVDAGDIVTYTLLVRNNTSVPSARTAYDVYIEDDLDDNVDFVPGSMACTIRLSSTTNPVTFQLADLSAPTTNILGSETAALDSFRIAGSVEDENANDWDLGPLDQVICTYNAVVLATIEAGDTAVTNTMDSVADTADDLQPEEDEVTGTVTETLTVPAPTIAKSVDTTAAQYQADGTYQPGEFVPWVITVQLPEGRTSSLVVSDTLPTGFSYVSGSVAFVAPTTGTINLTTQPAVGDTGTISWTFSSVDVTDSITSPLPLTDSITIRFLTRVTGSAPTGTATNETSGTYVPPGGTATSIGTDDDTVQVTRPSINVNKRATDAAGNDITTVDAQNQVRYEVTIRNDGPGQAFDAFFTDDLDPLTNFVEGSLDCRFADATIPDPVDFSTLPAITFVTTPDPILTTTDSFLVTGSLTEETNGWDLLDTGDRIICEYVVSIDENAVSGSDDITNDVTGNFDSFDGDDETPATPTDPFEENFTQDDDTTVSIPDPTISKTTPAAAPYQPGDTIPYEVIVTIPEGVTNGLIVEDQLPTGLVFIDLSEAPSSAWNGGTFTVPGDITQTYDTGTNVVRWTFNASVTNTPDNNPNDDTITFRYTVRVTGGAFTAGVNALDDVPNTARVLYTPPGGTPETEADTDDAQVDLRRPTIAVTKTVSPTGNVDAGDTLTYTTTITNNGPGVAYDVFFTDTLDPATNYVPGSMSCAAPGFAPDNFIIDDLDTVTVEDVRTTATADLSSFRVAQGLTESTNGWVLDVDESVVCTYDVTVNDYQDTIPVLSGDTDVTNDVTGNFDSFDGDDENPATTDDPFEQNYSDDDDATNTVPPPSFDKTRTSADDAVQAGEVVSYRVIVTVPEGNIAGLRIVDTLPTGFDINAASVNVSAGWASPALPAQTINATGNTLDITFNAEVQNPGDNNAVNNTITITYNATVTTAANTTPLPLSNNPATDAANTAEVFYTPSGTPTPVSLGTDQAFVDVIGPEIAVTKAIIDSSATEITNGVTDAGDTVTYRVTVTNTSTVATLYDVTLSDVRDTFLTLNAGSFTCSINGGAPTTVELNEVGATFTIGEDLTEDDNEWDLPPNAVLTCTYTMTVSASVPSGQLLENTITGTGDSANGSQPNEQTVTDDDDAQIGTAAPQLVSKDLDTTSGSYQPDGIYSPGDLVPYVVTIRIPEGAVNNLEFVDVVPTGLFLEISIAPVVSGGLTLAGAPTIDSGPGDGSAPTTYRFTFTSPAQVASGNNTDPFGYDTVNFVDITVSYSARVAAGAASGSLNNTATGEYNPAENPLTDVPIGSDPATITVDVPSLSLNKTGTPLLVDAADVVTYTVTLENTSAQVAYDAFITDDLDGFTTYAANLTCAVDNVPDANDVFVGITVAASGTDPITIDTTPAGGIDLQPDPDGAGGNPGGRLRCSYDVTIDADVPATTTLVNSATATFSTLDGDQGTNERTFTTPPDSQEVNTFAPQISKTFASGNPNYQADDTYAPGQLVPYQVTIRIPEGVALDLKFTDVIPAGLVYDSLLSVTGGPTLTAGSPSRTAGPGDGSAASTYLFQFNSPAQVANANNTGSIDYVDVVVTYLARVVIQTESATLTNSMRGTYDTGNGADDVEIGTGSVTVTTELPQIQTVKSITRVAADDTSPLQPYTPGAAVEAGNVIEYEVTVTNTDAAATLYDVVLSENPDSDVSFNAGSVSCTLGGAVVTPDTANADPFTIAGGANEDANTWDLAPGASVTCTYTVTVETTAAAGSTLDNTVTGTGNSANGSQPNEVTLNDDDSETAPLAGPEIRLRVVNPTDPANLPLVTIGRGAEYVITITLPAGTTSDLDVTTILEGDLTDANGDPIDLEYVSTVSITRGGTDLSGGVTVDATGTTGGERTIIWSFGSPIIYDPAAGGTNGVETIEIRFRALVPDVANNNDGDILDSSVSMTFSPDGGTTTVTVPEATDSLTDQDIQIAVPALVVDKTEDDVNNLVNPGQIVTYTITVSNVGTGLARNLVVDDLLPENWTYVAGSSRLNVATPISDPVITESNRQLTWTLDTDPLIGTDPVLNGVGSLTITYQALVPATLGVGPFDNFAQALGNDGISVSDPVANPIPEDNTDHVAGDTDPTDDALTSLNAAAAIEGLVWNDRNANGVIDGTEQPIIGVPVTLYRIESGIEVLVTSTTTSATPITFNGVTYPAGSYLFSELPPGDYVVVESQSGPIANWESTFDADTGTGGTEAERNRIVVNGLTGGEIVNNQDFGDRIAGRVQGFVYLDPNGNGSNTVPPDGGDSGFTPVTVTLTGVLEDGVTPYSDTVTTDINGFYQFVNVPDGTFTVTVDENAAVIQAVPNIDFTPGAVGSVSGLVVNSDAPNPVIPEAHFPFRAPVALTIIKNGYNLGTPPLDVDDTIGWIVCATNPDAQPADITVSDNIDTDRLTLVPGSIRAGVSAAATCPSSIADLGSLTLGAVTDTNTISVPFNDVPAGDHVVLYFETTINDPALWNGAGGWLGVLSLALYHLLTHTRQSRRARLAGQAAAVLLLAALLAGVFVTVNAVLAQEATDEPAPAQLEAPAEEGEMGEADAASPEASEAAQPEGTAEASDTPEATGAVTPEQTETATPLATETPTAEVTIPPATEATTEATVEATAEATVETTAEATAETTAEATVEATVEATAEATESVEPVDTVVEGRIFDDANASLMQDEGETGIPDVAVLVYEGETEIARATTDENGTYTFENLPTGDYQIVIDEATLPENYVDVTALGSSEAPPPAEIEVDEITGGEPADVATAEATDEASDETEAEVVVIDSPNFAFARDTDGDSAPDGVEGDGDRDNDGIPNYLDPFDPSGVLYIDQTGNPLADIEIALYADDGDLAFDADDTLAATLQQNPQTTAADGAYRFDIRVNVANPDAGDPIVDGLPEDGSTRRFFLVVNTTNLPENITFPSLLVLDSGVFDATPTEGSGEIVALSIAPNPPIDPSTHRFYLALDIAVGDDPVINNHIAFGSNLIVIDGLAVANVASASRPELPPVTAEARLPLNSSLDFTLVPNNYALLEPGETVTHGHILTNTGQQTDSYTITVPTGTQGWEQEVQIIRGGGLVTTITPGPSGTFVIENVAPGEEITINHIITVPPGAITGDIDTTSITAVSVTDDNLVRNVTDITETLAACFEGIIYNDTNQNGSQDVDEPGIGGVRLFIYDSTNALIATLVSAGDGSYDLGGLASGEYRAEVDLTSLPAGTPLFVPDGSEVQTFNFTAGTDCSLGTFGLVLFDPALVKTGRPENARVGDVITFNITVTNNSTTQITNVVVVDPLSSYLDFVSASGIDAASISFDAGTNSVTFNIGTMVAGQVINLVVIAEVNESAPEPGTVINRAIFTYDEGPRQTRETTVRIRETDGGTNDDDDDNGGGGNDPTPVPPVVPPPPAQPVAPPVAVAQAGVPGAVGEGRGIVPDEFPGVLPQTGEPIQTSLLVAVFAAGVVTALVFAGLVSLSGLFLRKWIVRSLRSNLARLIGGLMLLLAISMGAGWFAFSTMLVVPAVIDGGEQVAQNPAVMESEANTAAEPRVQPAAPVEVAAPEQPVETITLAEWNNQFQQAEIPATRIVIPALDIDTDLTQARIENGTWNVSTFHNEIAHLEGTAFPGTRGNAVLAGHVTHALGLGPFHKLDQLSEGDVILAYGEGVEYRYVVDSVHYAEPDEIAYTYPPLEPGSFLTLITCAGWDQSNQQYTQRIVIRAQQVNRS